MPRIAETVFRAIVHHVTCVVAQFSPTSRSALTFALLACLVCCTYLPSAITTSPIIDEMVWVDRSLQPLNDRSLPNNYYYAIHHPAFARIVYGSALHAMDVSKVGAPLPDYAHDVQWNVDHGAYPPYRVELALRLVNVAFLSGMLAFVYFGFKFIFRNRALAALACLPLISNYPIGSPIGACPYIGTDSILLFWLAAFWYVWLRWGRARWGALALGVIAGFLVATKVNGAFTVAGACIYLAVTARGMARVTRPATLIIVSAAIFVALNPVYRAGGVAAGINVTEDVVRLMMSLKDKTAGDAWAQFSRAEVLRESFPYWFLILPSMAVILSARREKWFAPTAAWCAATLLPNWLLIYVPLLRYSAPISLAFMVLFAAAGLFILIEAYKRAVAAGEPLAWTADAPCIAGVAEREAANEH